MRRGVALLALLLAACGQGAAQPPPAQSSATLAGGVTVFAAASLTDAFEDLGARFSAAHPDVDIAFNFGSSSTLATQIVQGAPADVFASADFRQMDVVADRGMLAGEPQVFTANGLEIAVEPGNPGRIETLADLARPDVTLVLAAADVPAGRYAREALDAQGLTVQPASEEVDVRAVLARVALGEADAGIVYASDVASADDRVGGVPIPAEQNVAADYPIAVLRDAPNPPVAEAFAAYLLSTEGQAVLDEHGFDQP